MNVFSCIIYATVGLIYISYVSGILQFAGRAIASLLEPESPIVNGQWYGSIKTREKGNSFWMIIPRERRVLINNVQSLSIKGDAQWHC